MVAEADEPERVLELWRAGRASELELLSVVRDAMYQAARRAIWMMTGERPDPHAVHEAVGQAFRELWAKDADTVEKLVGMAAVIADRRGRDQARRYITEQRKARELTEQLGDRLSFAQLDEDAAERRAELIGDTRDCLSGLTDDQRVVIEQTVYDGVALSDWAHAQGKSYEAARAQRQRGFDAIKRCLERKKRESDAAEQNGGST